MTTSADVVGTWFDGVRAISWFVEAGKLVRQERQPARDVIMKRVQRLRIENREALKPEVAHLRPTAMIPEQDFDYLLARNPDLKAPDAEIRAKAWKKFLALEGAIYVTNPPRLDKWR